MGIFSIIAGTSKGERKRVQEPQSRTVETFLIVFVRFRWTNRSG